MDLRTSFSSSKNNSKFICFINVSLLNLYINLGKIYIFIMLSFLFKQKLQPVVYSSRGFFFKCMYILRVSC